MGEIMFFLSHLSSLLVFISKEHLLHWKECNSLKVTNIYVFFLKYIEYCLVSAPSLSSVKVHAVFFLVDECTLWSPFMQAKYDAMIQHLWEERCIGGVGRGTCMYECMLSSWSPGSFTRPWVWCPALPSIDRRRLKEWCLLRPNLCLTPVRSKL